jgi:hypothetical protein
MCFYPQPCSTESPLREYGNEAQLLILFCFSRLLVRISARGRNAVALATSGEHVGDDEAYGLRLLPVVGAKCPAVAVLRNQAEIVPARRLAPRATSARLS